jgi:hypothetical protein
MIYPTFRGGDTQQISTLCPPDRVNDRRDFLAGLMEKKGQRDVGRDVWRDLDNLCTVPVDTCILSGR